MKNMNYDRLFEQCTAIVQILLGVTMVAFALVGLCMWLFGGGSVWNAAFTGMMGFIGWGIVRFSFRELRNI